MIIMMILTVNNKKSFNTVTITKTKIITLLFLFAGAAVKRAVPMVLKRAALLRKFMK